MARKRHAADSASSAAVPAVLRRAQDEFIAAWGKMGSTWGISRTMAEIHALLYITGTPLNTDDVMERLAISRGNASMSLRALVEWGIVSRVHRRGDRKEYYEAEHDAWALVRNVIRERLRREVHPLLASLYEIRDMMQTAGGGTGGGAGGVAEHNRRLDSLLELVTTIDRLGERFVGSEGKGLKLAASVLSKIS
jgi:DNA-binding transcriptional regulator GbsR (MarR family)